MIGNHHHINKCYPTSNTAYAWCTSTPSNLANSKKCSAFSEAHPHLQPPQNCLRTSSRCRKWRAFGSYILGWHLHIAKRICESSYLNALVNRSIDPGTITQVSHRPIRTKCLSRGHASGGDARSMHHTYFAKTRFNHVFDVKIMWLFFSL